MFHTSKIIKGQFVATDTGMNVFSNDDQSIQLVLKFKESAVPQSEHQVA